MFLEWSILLVAVVALIIVINKFDPMPDRRVYIGVKNLFKLGFSNDFCDDFVKRYGEDPVLLSEAIDTINYSNCLKHIDCTKPYLTITQKTNLTITMVNLMIDGIHEPRRRGALRIVVSYLLGDDSAFSSIKRQAEGLRMGSMSVTSIPLIACICGDTLPEPVIKIILHCGRWVKEIDTYHANNDFRKLFQEWERVK